MVPREIFEPKGQEAARDWRKLRNEELHNLYSTPNIIQVIKPTAMILTGQVVRTAGRKCKQGFGGKEGREDTT